MKAKHKATKVKAGAIGPGKREPMVFAIPKEVEILDQRWTVVVCPPWSDSGVVGDCDHGQRRIRISAALAPGMAVEVFIHELLHAMISAAGCRVDYEAEEQVVSTLAPLLWDTFRRNKVALW